MDEVVQSAYLTLTPSVVALELDIAPGSQMAGALFRPLDANADHHIPCEWREAKLVIAPQNGWTKIPTGSGSPRWPSG